MPFSSWFASTTAARLRSRPIPYEPMTMGTDPPFSSCTYASIATLYFVPSLKMWPTSIVLWTEKGVLHIGTALAALHLAQIEPGLHVDVARDVDAAQVEAVLVGAGHHLAPSVQRLVGDDVEIAPSDGARGSRAARRGFAGSAPGRPRGSSGPRPGRSASARRADDPRAAARGSSCRRPGRRGS